MLNSVGTDVTRSYSFKYSPKVRKDNDYLTGKMDNGFKTPKIDSEFQVDKTSDEYKSIMKLYDDICKDYPDVSFRLDDRETSNAYQKKYGTECMAYLGYGNSMNQVGDNFGELSQKSVEIDVPILKKCLSDPDYKKAFMSQLDSSINGYQQWINTARDLNASNMCIGFLDVGDGVAMYSACANVPFVTEVEIRQRYGKSEAYAQNMIIQKSKEIQNELTEDYMNTLSEHNKTLHNKLLTDPSKDLYEKVRSSAYESQSRIYKKSAVEAVDADDEVSEEKLQGIGLTSFGISDAESRLVLASYVKDSGEDDPVVQIAYGQGDDRKVYHIHVNDVDISNASDMEMFALLSYEGYKGRTAPGAINNYSAYKTLKAGEGYEMGSADENCFVDEKINVKHLMQKIYDSLKDHKTAEEEKSFEECDYLRWLITNRKVTVHT